MKFETEIKLRLSEDTSKIRRSLRRLGFRVARPRALESNVLFDNPKDPLGKRGKLIRVRRVRGEALLTYKGPSSDTRYKKRHELEVRLSNAAAAQEILQHLGYQPVYYYQKFRTEFVQTAGRGTVMLDETPVGNFLELEGAPRWIDRTARLLGFSSADYITGSYGYLHLLYCRERGLVARDMLFRPHANTRALLPKQP